MVTLNNADSVLKSFYLDAVTEALNTKINPLLAKIEKTTANVTGKDVRKALSCGFNNGIGAGSETGELPTAYGNEYYEMLTTLKNFYGTIEISDKALRAAADSEGAFVNILNEEMKTLINTAKFNFGRMLFGDGSGVLGRVTETIDENTVYVDHAENFVAGMRVDLVSNERNLKGLRVDKVDYVHKIVKVQTEDVIENFTDIYFTMPNKNGNHEELTGLAAIFSDVELYGLDRSVPCMKPYYVPAAANPTAEEIQIAIDTIEGLSGYKPNFIVCSWAVRRALVESYKKNGFTLPTMQIEGGVTAYSFNGIPIVVDRFCPKNTMYLLNTDFLKLHQLCDWQWLETEDGKILKQVPGKPVYTATLVKYAELLCDNISAQGKIEFEEI
jgi:hypothetical protein